MKSSECKLHARENLSGKWGKAICITLVYVLLFLVFGFAQNYSPEAIQPILSIIVAIIEVPLVFGLNFSLFKLYNEEDVNVFDFLTLGFSNFAKSWKISLRIVLKMIMPVILLIVSYIVIGVGISLMIASALNNSSNTIGFLAITIIGFLLLIISMIWAITKSYYYQLSYLVAFDNEDLSALESIEKSKELMTGNRGSLFILQLSFIGWAVLATLTLGIGYLWLIPYIQFTTTAFYKALNEPVSNTETN